MDRTTQTLWPTLIRPFAARLTRALNAARQAPAHGARIMLAVLAVATICGCKSKSDGGSASLLRQRILAPPTVLASNRPPVNPPPTKSPPEGVPPPESVVTPPASAAPQPGSTPRLPAGAEPLPLPGADSAAAGAAVVPLPPLPSHPGSPATPPVRLASAAAATPQATYASLGVGGSNGAIPTVQFVDAPLTPISLDEAIDTAWRLNPRLEMLRERVAEAEGGRTVARADLFPEASGTFRHVQGTPSDHPFVLPTMPNYLGVLAPAVISDRFERAELNVQWIMWDFGRTGGKIGQSAAAVEIARLQFDRARQSVAFDVTASYYSVLQSQAGTRIAEEAVVRADSVLRDARNFFQRGTGIRNDVLRADVLLAEMQLNLVKARTNTAAAVATLNQAMGVNVSCPTRIIDQVDEPAFRLSLPECLQLAADNRDEFRVVLNAIRSSRLGRDVAQAEFMPRVLVGGVAASQNAHDSVNETVVAGGVNLELALFEGGRRIGKLREAEAGIRDKVAQGKEICDRIAYEVNLAFLGIQDARQRIELTRTTVAQANENLRVVRSLLAKGDSTPTELVDAILSITRAQQNYASALYDYKTNLARLTYAAGLPNTPGLSASLFVACL